MSIWIICQIVFNLALVVGGCILWFKLSRLTKEDPRLNRGLEILQGKISIIEDLSDRTEVQVKQLTSLMDKKTQQLKGVIHKADMHCMRVEQERQKSLEVAEIFQDKIPHNEIIDRQNRVKYVTAARMAHRGLSKEDIAKEVDLPEGELDFIIKVNRDQLTFEESKLPPWAQQDFTKRGPQGAIGASHSIIEDESKVEKESSERAERAKSP